jgi:rare lipoprotein A
MLALRTLAVAVLCLALSPALAKPATHMVKSKPKPTVHAIKSKPKPAAYVTKSKPKPTDRMVASIYWEGKRVATGKKFDPNGMTVAHKSLPFGTRLVVYYGSNAAEVVVNDRGPFVHGREIDLSRGAAKALHFSGVGKVRVVFWPPLPPNRPAELTELSKQTRDQCASAESDGCR